MPNRRVVAVVLLAAVVVVGALVVALVTPRLRGDPEPDLVALWTEGRQRLMEDDFDGGRDYRVLRTEFEGSCAGVVYSNPGEGIDRLTVFMRGRGASWNVVDVVTGDVTPSINDAYEDCWRR